MSNEVPKDTKGVVGGWRQSQKAGESVSTPSAINEAGGASAAQTGTKVGRWLGREAPKDALMQEQAPRRRKGCDDGHSALS